MKRIESETSGKFSLALVPHCFGDSQGYVSFARRMGMNASIPPIVSLSSRRSMDRTHPCGGCNVGSIPTESTNEKSDHMGRLFHFVLSVPIKRIETAKPSLEVGLQVTLLKHQFLIYLIGTHCAVNRSVRQRLLGHTKKLCDTHKIELFQT